MLTSWIGGTKAEQYEGLLMKRRRWMLCLWFGARIASTGMKKQAGALCIRILSTNSAWLAIRAKAATGRYERKLTYKFYPSEMLVPPRILSIVKIASGNSSRKKRRNDDA